MIDELSATNSLSFPLGVPGAGLSTILYPVIFTSCNHSTAALIAFFISSDGLGCLIRNSTIFTLSEPLIEGNSYALAFVGRSVDSSYCWHQAVSLSFTLICVFKIHSMPLLTAFALGSIKSALTISRSFCFSITSCLLYTSDA